jgi:hypothetical protein
MASVKRTPVDVDGLLALAGSCGWWVRPGACPQVVVGERGTAKVFAGSRRELALLLKWRGHLAPSVQVNRQMRGE